MPVIAASEPGLDVHALLHHDPFAGGGHNEIVQVKLKAIGDRIVIDPRGKATGADQRLAFYSTGVGESEKFFRRLARVLSAAAANDDAQFMRLWIQPALQRAEHRSGDAGGMPIHPHHASQRLEPEWIAEAGEELRSAVVMHDSFGDGRTQLGHALRKPARDTSSVQRQFGNSGALHTSMIERPPLRITSSRYWSRPSTSAGIPVSARHCRQFPAAG